MRVLVNKGGLQLRRAFYSTFFPFIISLSFEMAAPQCFSRRPRLSENHILCPFCDSPQVLIPVEAGKHDDEEGRHVEEEEAREEGAQPGEHEQGGANQGEVQHGGGGLHPQCGQWRFGD